MRCSRDVFVCMVVIATLALPAIAQHHGGSHLSRLPSATLPPPPLMDGLGTATMEITTDSERAQQFFNQGLRLLHCFWDFEAYRAFKEAIRQDPDAVMPYWGLFMSLNYNPVELYDERKAALEKAKSLAAQASLRERRYIGAISQFDSKGQTAYIRAMESLVSKHPEDLQAQLMLIKYLVTDAGGQYPQPGGGTGNAFEHAQGLLRPLLESHPDSAAVHHYWVHAHEVGPNPGAALASAEKLPRLAPKSGHILHMPGHIHYLIGDYEKARRAFETSLAFDRAYMETSGVGPVDHWNYTHNLDYLVANCAEDGRYQEGLKYAGMLRDLPVEQERSKAAGLGYIVYGGRTAPARLHLRYGHWQAAAKSLEAVANGGERLSQQASDYLHGLLSYAQGMAAFERGDLAAAGAGFQTLLKKSVELTRQERGTGSDWYFDVARRILTVGAVELGGLVMSRQGQHDKAIQQLEQAIQMERILGYGEPPHYSRPVQESLGAAYLQARQWEAARHAYEQALEKRPNNGHAWFGIARSYELAGNKDQAGMSYRRFLEVWRHADRDLPQIRQAEAWLAKNP